MARRKAEPVVMLDRDFAAMLSRILPPELVWELARALDRARAEEFSVEYPDNIPTSDMVH